MNEISSAEPSTCLLFIYWSHSCQAKYFGNFEYASVSQCPLQSGYRMSVSQQINPHSQCLCVQCFNYITHCRLHVGFQTFMHTTTRVDVPQTNSSCHRMNVRTDFNVSLEPAHTSFYTGQTAKSYKNKQTSFLSAGVLTRHQIK